MLEVKEGFRVARFYIDGKCVAFFDEISYPDKDAFMYAVNGVLILYSNRGISVDLTIGQ